MTTISIPTILIFMTIYARIHILATYKGEKKIKEKIVAKIISLIGINNISIIIIIISRWMKFLSKKTSSLLCT